MKRRPASAIRTATAPRGFTLIEVMIALVVTATGLLGVAKIQAAAIANTKISGSRALIAIQTGSLVSAMHANRAFWAAGMAPSSWRVLGDGAPSATVLTADFGKLAGCSTTCSPQQLAALDVHEWTASMAAQFPTYEAQVDCTAKAVSAPVSCTAFVSWEEKAIAINSAAKRDDKVQQTRETFSVHFQP